MTLLTCPPTGVNEPPIPSIDRFAVKEYKSGRAGTPRKRAGAREILRHLTETMSQEPTEHTPIEAIDQRVRNAGLRPTRQRIALARLLFAKGDRHLSAEELHEEAIGAGVPVSLATVYNALHQFTNAGLLRILAVEGAKTYFDTNTSDHHHFFVEGENRVFDIETGPVQVLNLPEPPEGMEICNVDVVVRLRPRQA